MPTDPFNLRRFVAAQEPLFDTVLAELRAGRKRTHWMWFVFPQLRGLGRSATAEFYGLASLDEARAYLAHAVLGPRLVLCTDAVADRAGRSLAALFGSPDDMKFVSCMTLFAHAASESESAFRHALVRWNNGNQDDATVRLLRERP